MTTKKAFILLLFPLMLASITVSCSAQQTEQQALESLRQMTKDGKLPPEGVVSPIESRFAGKRTGGVLSGGNHVVERPETDRTILKLDHHGPPLLKTHGTTHLDRQAQAATRRDIDMHGRGGGPFRSGHDGSL